MHSFIHSAREEMKRADHLLYVSLKYTRTVDVIKRLIERLVNTIDAIIDNLLDHALDKKSINEKPDNLGLKGDLAKKTFKDSVITEMVEFSLFLKQVNRAECKRSKEFRRHVTMTALTDTGPVNVDIDTIKEYYLKTKEWLEHAERVIYGEQETI